MGVSEEDKIRFQRNQKGERETDETVKGKRREQQIVGDERRVVGRRNQIHEDPKGGEGGQGETVRSGGEGNEIRSVRPEGGEENEIGFHRELKRRTRDGRNRQGGRR